MDSRTQEVMDGLLETSATPSLPLLHRRRADAARSLIEVLSAELDRLRDIREDDPIDELNLSPEVEEQLRLIKAEVEDSYKEELEMLRKAMKTDEVRIRTMRGALHHAKVYLETKKRDRGVKEFSGQLTLDTVNKALEATED